MTVLAGKSSLATSLVNAQSGQMIFIKNIQRGNPCVQTGEETLPQFISLVNIALHSHQTETTPVFAGHTVTMTESPSPGKRPILSLRLRVLSMFRAVSPWHGR